MQFNAAVIPQKIRRGQTLYDENGLYEHDINFYTVPPFGKISLEEAEDMVTERLNLLKEIDEMMRAADNNPNFKRDRGYFNIMDTKLKGAETKFEKNFYEILNDGRPKDQILNARKRDVISHFLLRIYYCRNEELKKWFISRECELLRCRLIKTSNYNELPLILKKNGFDFEEATKKEITDLYNLIFWNQTDGKKDVASLVVYKLPFEQAVEAVKNRRVWLSSGFAYIPIQDMFAIICSKFRANLSHSLAVIQKSLHLLEEDERLIPRLHSLHLHHINIRKRVKTEDSDTELVTPEMIDDLAKESFPPCMRNIHEVFRKEHHLKYYGRVHYQLFLKTIGLTLDDALNFFREEFTKKMAPEKFAKEYAYGIRYNYGKEGRKVSGKAYGCQKIMDNPPGPADTHGCPFKHFDKTHLNQMLVRHQINAQTANEILDLVEQQNYSMACSRYFNSKHNWYPEINIYHPNQYYSESRKALKMQGLTPPPSGQLLSNFNENPNDVSLFDRTTESVDEESFLETEDDFEKSIESMDFDVSGSGLAIEVKES